MKTPLPCIGWRLWLASALALVVGMSAVPTVVLADDDDEDRQESRDDREDHQREDRDDDEDRAPPASPFTLERAVWQARRGRLVVKGKGSAGQTVRVVNARDAGQALGERRVNRKRNWRLRAMGLHEVPCRVRAVQSNGQSAERDVKNAPKDCVPGGTGEPPPPPPPPNQAPTCGIDNPNADVTVNTGDSVRFTGTASDPDGHIAQYSWSFAGGSPASASVEDPGNVTYTRAGRFTARLTARDDQGASCAAATRTVTVQAPPPPPAPNQAPTCTIDAPGGAEVSIHAGDQVSFSGTAADPDGFVASISWSLSGGEPSSANVAVPGPVTYSSPGTYTASLAATDNDGETCTPDTLKVTVGSAVPPPTGGPHGGIMRYDGPSTCIQCHEGQAVAMHGSVHYQESGPTPNVTNINGPAGERGGGAIGINTYCGSHENSPRFTCAGCHVGNGRFPKPSLPATEPARGEELANIDCLMCHQEAYQRFPVGPFEPLALVREGANGLPDPGAGPLLLTGPSGVPIMDPTTGDFQFEPADEASLSQLMSITRLEAARTVHKTTRRSCLNCHAGAGGSDGTKRGDMSSALVDPARNVDFHMSSAGADLTCSDCHDAGNHRVRGRGLDLRPNDVPERFTCESCHNRPHGDFSNTRGSSRDKHAMKVACQTCHIPSYAKGVPTEVSRDWEHPHFSPSACNGRGGWLPTEVKAGDLTPSYAWFDGTSQVYYLGERLDRVPTKALADGTRAFVLGQPNGGVTTAEAKIYPMKEHLSNLARDTVRNELIAHSTFEFFRTGDFAAAVESGLEQAGRAGDAYDVVQVHTYQTINHGVEPKSNALDCGACHASLGGGPLRMDLQSLGYGLKGPQSQVCTQCHGRESSGFSSVHSRHVQSKRYDCSWCHNFSRPERGLRMP